MTDQTRTALLSKLRAPVAEVQIGVGVTEQGAKVCLMQPHADGSATVIYSETHPIGDSVGRAALASAPVAGEAMPVEHRLRSWEKLKTQLGSAEWSVAESVSYRGFFMLGLEAAIEHYVAPQASEAVRDVSNIAGQLWDDAIACDWPAFKDKVVAALSAQPGAQRTGGSDAE